GLPAPPSRLIGREHELALAERLLFVDRARLITFTGPAGVGKTRLALEVARRAVAPLGATAAAADLAPLADAGQVAAAIAHAIGLAERPDRPLLVTLREYLARRPFLLLLDNAEHVLAAATDLAALLPDC